MVIKSALRTRENTPDPPSSGRGKRLRRGDENIGFLRQKVNITFSRKLPGGYSLYAARFSKNQHTRFFGWSETPLDIFIYFYGGKKT